MNTKMYKQSKTYNSPAQMLNDEYEQILSII